MSRRQTSLFTGLGRAPRIVLGALLFVGSAYAASYGQTPQAKEDKPGEAKKDAAGQTKPTSAVATTQPSAATAGKATASVAGPRIQIDEPIHHFGEVWVTPSLKHTFEIRNSGTEVLKITKVKASCGCTVSGPYDREIPPGGVGKVPLTLKTRNLKTFSKYATITSNDRKNPTTKVTLKGTIKYYVSADPQRVYFHKVRPSDALKKTVKIKANTEQAKLELVGDGKLGKFQVSLTRGPAADEYELIVEGIPPFDEGRYSGNVEIKTNVPQQPMLQIPVSAYVPKRVEIRPGVLTINRPATRRTKRYVTVTNNGETPVEVLSAAVSDPSIKTELKEMVKGKSYKITLDLPAHYLPPTKGETLTLKLLDETEREHVISILPPKAPRKSDTRRQRPAMTMLGKPAPKTVLNLNGGATYEVGGAGEQITVLNFYTSWCGYCKRQMPVVEKAYQLFKDNPNVRFVAVSEDVRTGKRGRPPEKVVEEFNKREMTHALALDQDKIVGQAFKVTSYPSLFVLGKDGRIEAVHLGATKDLAGTLKEEVEQLLAGKKLARAPASESDAALKAKPAAPKPTIGARKPQ